MFSFINFFPNCPLNITKGGSSLDENISIETMTEQPLFSSAFIATPTLFAPVGARTVEEASWNCKNVSSAKMTTSTCSFLIYLWLFLHPPTTTETNCLGWSVRLSSFLKKMQNIPKYVRRNLITYRFVLHLKESFHKIFLVDTFFLRRNTNLFLWLVHHSTTCHLLLSV